ASAYMDDVTIDLAPDCIEPEGLTISNIGGRTAQINWIASTGNPDYYDLEIIETATEYSVVQENLYGETSYLAEGLDPNTSYTVKLYSVCEGGAVYSPLVTTTFNTLNTTDCATPNLFKVSNVTAYTADLSWVKDGLHDNYYIEYKTASAIAWENETINSYNSLELFNLTPASTYTARIRSICDDDENSAWATITFETPCATIISMPFTENFNNTPDGDNSNGLLPHCWASNNSHTANKPYVNTQTTINEQFHSAYGALDFQHAPGYNIVILPPIDLSESGYNLNDLAVNFWAKAENITAGEFHLGVMGNTMDTATFTPVYAITLDSTTIWKEFYIPLTDYEGDGQYIAFRWRNASDNSVSVDDIYIDFTTTCTRPESLTMDSVTAHEVYFSWVDEVNVSWEAVCVSSNDALNWANAVPVSGLAGNLSNLSPNTKYTLYLRTTCGSDSYSLPLSFSFTTACAPITPGDLPYTEDFNNYGAGSSTYFPTCWTRASQTSTTNPYISSTYNSSPGSLYFLGNATNYVSAVTEKFDMQVNTLQMTFEFRSGNLSVPITIGVMTNPNDPTSFDTITSVFASKINTWEKHTVYLNNYQGTGQYIAFRTIGATAVYLDDIKIDLAPDCIPVQNLAISNLTTSSADFTWTGPENAESYEIEVGLPGFTPGDGSAVITAVATDDFYNITPGDLDEAKAYVFAIRSFCGGDDGESIWTLLNFATIADETYGDEIWHGYVYKSPTPDVPANRFGTYLGKVFEQPIFNRDPGSSTTISWTGDSAVWAGTAPSEYFAVRYKMTYDFPCDYYTFTFTGIDDAIRFSVDGGQNWVSLCHTNGNCGPQYSWTTLAYPTGTFTGKAQMDGPADLILEYFNAAGGKKCAFSYAPAAIGISTSDIKINSIDVDFTDGEEWDIIVSTSVQTDLTNPTNVVANHTGITSNPYTIPGLTPETIYYIYAKLACGTVWGNTSATTLPSCPAVTNLQATATTTNTATVTWVENGTSTNWEIEYGNAGFTLGTGYTATVSGTPSYNITANLSASNSYDFYVRSICSSSDTSAWSAKGNFATECDVITQLPYTENFNSYSPASTSDRNVFPNCWSRYSTGANLPYIANWGTTHVYEGTGYSLDFAYTPTYYTLAILPAFDTSIPVNTLTVSFQGRSGTGSSGNFTIGVMDNALDYSSFVPVDTAHNHTTAFQPYAISLASYTGTGQIIAFKWEGGNSNGYYLDELVINYATALTCAVPTGLTATNIEANSATAGWNASATAVTYTLEYKKSADATYNAPVTGIATTSHPLTGLEAGTQYDVRVKSVCTDGESNFTAAFTFTTESKPCPEPTNLSVSQITGESAVATWTKGGDETSWKVEYKVKSSSGGYTSVTVTTPSYPISDLEAETEYEVCVKADCGGSESTRACTTFTTSAAGTTYKIEASAGSNGSINPSGSVTVAEGADI
ncbi:fibronectin type III domain-containing protein, partial [Bacteroidales bacterium OttesenSCG-928-C03]|nr:fibronectin type III domain-containing protein [Bacteroidales bacterium OttesenSCG-928-C03]